jgi:hypothetical protein
MDDNRHPQHRDDVSVEQQGEILDPNALPSEGLSLDPEERKRQVIAMYRFMQWHGIDRYFE